MPAAITKLGRLLVAMAGLMPLVAPAQSRTEALAQVAGTWRGESTCVSKDSACRDESVVYRFAAIPGKPGYVSASADKIVDGKGVNMGTLEFRYAEDQRAFLCDYAQGVWRLTMNGGKMDGTLTRRDSSIFRRVSLRKEP